MAIKRPPNSGGAQECAGYMMRQEEMNTYLNTNKLQLRELEAKVIMIVIDDQFAGTD